MVQWRPRNKFFIAMSGINVAKLCQDRPQHVEIFPPSSWDAACRRKAPKFPPWIPLGTPWGNSPAANFSNLSSTLCCSRVQVMSGSATKPAVRDKHQKVWYWTQNKTQSLCRKIWQKKQNANQAFLIHPNLPHCAVRKMWGSVGLQTCRRLPVGFPIDCPLLESCMKK